MARASLALLLFVVSLPMPAAPSVSDLVARYRAARLGDGRQISNLELTIGHARLSVPSGAAAPVMAGEERIGVFIHGAGTFTYETVNTDEFAALRYNAKHGDIKLQATADKITIQEPLRSVLLLGSPLPDLGTAAGTAPAAEFASHRESFAREFSRPPGEHLLAMRALDAPSAKVVRLEIDGTGHQLVYTYDEAFSRTEKLQRLWKLQELTSRLKGLLFTTEVSEQGAGRKSREEAPPRVMLTHLDVDLTASDGEDASMVVTEKIQALRPLSVLRFDLYTDYWFDANRDPRRYNVRSVTDAKGNNLPFVHANNELLVSLGAPATKGQQLELKFTIDGNFLYRPGGDNYWELGLEAPRAPVASVTASPTNSATLAVNASPRRFAWFPQPEWNEQGYTYHGVMKVKKPFVPISPGKTIRRATEGEYNIHESSIDQPVMFVSLLAGRYYLEEFEQKGVKVRVASYALKNAQAAKQLAGIVFAAIEYYPLFLGPFPFTEVNLIEKADLGYEQTPPGIMFITRDAFQPKSRDAKEVQGINMRLAHEVAHQYWGIAVKMPSPAEQWLTEAFAEYSAAMFMSAAGRKKDYDRALSTWRADAKSVMETSSIATANQLSNPGDPLGRSMARQGLVYSKGSYLLYTLHKELSDDPFMTFLKSYQKSFRWQFGTTEDVVGLLEYMTRKPYQPFFDQYFYGTAMPK